MTTPVSKYDLLYPEKNILSALRDLTEGKLGGDTFLRRALVVEIDHVGGKLEEKPTQNPKGSIRARIISEPSPHTFLENADLPVFWPLFPYDTFPLKETEHVYVIFETPSHGIWLSRIPEPFDVDNKNITPGIEKYKLNGANISEQQIQDLSSAAEPLEASPEFQKESVPKFTARIGDRTLQGSNNTLVVLGRDRADTVSSGEKSQAGTIDLVAGRVDEENMNMKDDKSRIFITMNSDVDGNFDIKVGEASGPSSAIVVKSDEIRIISRNGMKIIVEAGDVTIDAKTIILGKDASESAVLGDKLTTELGKIIDAFTTPGIVGMLGQLPISLTPTIGVNLNQIKGLLKQNILSTINKVK